MIEVVRSPKFLEEDNLKAFRRSFTVLEGMFREHLERAEVPHDVKLYPEAGHSFMSIHRPALRPLGYLPPMFARHHPEAAADAWERVLTFFDRHLSHAPV